MNQSEAFIISQLYVLNLFGYTWITTFYTSTLTTVCHIFFQVDWSKYLTDTLGDVRVDITPSTLIATRTLKYIKNLDKALKETDNRYKHYLVIWGKKFQDSVVAKGFICSTS